MPRGSRSAMMAHSRHQTRKQAGRSVANGRRKGVAGGARLRPASAPAAWSDGKFGRVEAAENCERAAWAVFWLISLALALLARAVPSAGQQAYVTVSAMTLLTLLAVAGCCAGYCRWVTWDEVRREDVRREEARPPESVAPPTVIARPAPSAAPRPPIAATSPARAQCPPAPVGETAEAQRLRLATRRSIPLGARLDEEARFLHAVKHHQPTPEEREHQARLRDQAHLQSRREAELSQLEARIFGDEATAETRP